MPTFSDDDLGLIERTPDLYVAPLREDGTTYGTVTQMWALVVEGKVPDARRPESATSIGVLLAQAGFVVIAATLRRVVERAEAPRVQPGLGHRDRFAV